MAFISDIHGNFVALQAVLERLTEEKIYCLGDIVGYGPEPCRCVETVRAASAGSIQGNHDAAIAGELDYSSFNSIARRATDWSRKRLDPEELRYLQNLPAVIEKEEFCLFHGSPSRPLQQYVDSPADIRTAYSEADFPKLLGLGHTHKPYLYLVKEEQYIRPSSNLGQKIKLPPGGAVFNPGSVGQPRDGDPRASFVRYWPDKGQLAFYRVKYDIVKVCEKIKEEGLPPFLCERLRGGY